VTRTIVIAVVAIMAFVILGAWYFSNVFSGM
jgi:hypothetical protein